MVTIHKIIFIMDRKIILEDIQKGFFRLSTKDVKTLDVIFNGLRKMEQLVPDVTVITKNNYILDINKLHFIPITTIESMHIVFITSKIGGDGIYLEVEDFLMDLLLRNSKFIPNSNDERSVNFYSVWCWDFLEVYWDVVKNYIPLSKQIENLERDIKYHKSRLENMENELNKLKNNSI